MNSNAIHALVQLRRNRRSGSQRVSASDRATAQALLDLDAPTPSVRFTPTPSVRFTPTPSVRFTPYARPRGGGMGLFPYPSASPTPVQPQLSASSSMPHHTPQPVSRTLLNLLNTFHLPRSSSPPQGNLETLFHGMKKQATIGKRIYVPKSLSALKPASYQTLGPGYIEVERLSQYVPSMRYKQNAAHEKGNMDLGKKYKDIVAHIYARMRHIASAIRGGSPEFGAPNAAGLRYVDALIERTRPALELGRYNPAP